MLRHRLLASTSVLVLFLALTAPASMMAQRAFRIGGGMSSLSPRDGGSASTGWTGTLGYLATSTSETDFFLSRWGATGFGTGKPGVTTFGIEDRYYPVEATGIAPFLTTAIGAFKYADPGGILTPPSDQWGFVSAMGLGLGTTIGQHFWIGGEGRLRVDNGFRSTELRMQGSYDFGPLKAAQSRPGTIEPFVIGIARLGHGPYRASSPYAGIRFRREESRHASIAVDAGIVKFESTERSTVWQVLPSAEYGWRTTWGRPFIEIGPQMLGFVGGIDDGMRYGIHTGGGVDVDLGQAVELGLLSRLTWFQSGDNRHQFGLQLGVAIGPRLLRDGASLPDKVPAAK